MRRVRLGLLGTALLAAAACGRDSTVPGTAAAGAALPADQIMVGANHTMTKGGVREAILRSDTAYFRESANEADLVGVKLEFFDEKGAPSGQLTSRTGHYDLRTGAMTATGSVVLDINMEGRQRRIETEELHYDLRGDRIWSDKPTTSREGATVYRGSSFTSDARFRNVQVQGASTTGGVETGGTGISF